MKYQQIRNFKLAAKRPKFYSKNKFNFLIKMKMILNKLCFHVNSDTDESGKET